MQLLYVTKCDFFILQILNQMRASSIQFWLVSRLIRFDSSVSSIMSKFISNLSKIDFLGLYKFGTCGVSSMSSQSSLRISTSLLFCFANFFELSETLAGTKKILTMETKHNNGKKITIHFNFLLHFVWLFVQLSLTF